MTLVPPSPPPNLRALTGWGEENVRDVEARCLEAEWKEARLDKIIRMKAHAQLCREGVEVDSPSSDDEEGNGNAKGPTFAVDISAALPAQDPPPHSVRAETEDRPPPFRPGGR